MTPRSTHTPREHPGATAPVAGPPAPRRTRRTVVLVVTPIAVVLVAIVAVVAVVKIRQPKPPPGRPESEAFLAAWTAGDTAAMLRLVSDPLAPVAKDLEETLGPLDAKNPSYRLDAVQGNDDKEVSATFEASMTIPGLGDWTYQGLLPLQVSDDDSVKIVWSRAVIHPAVGPGQKLDQARQRPDRAALYGADGQALVQKGPSITIAAVPGRIRDQAALAKALSDNLGLDPASVDRALKQPWVKPDSQVPLLSVRRETYDRVKPAIYDVPGLQFVQGASRLPPSPDFARHLIGRTGPVTADQLKQLGPTYLATDEVGQTGIEAAYEKQLAGTPSGDVHVVDASGRAGRVLQQFTGVAPTPVRTTIDPKTQQAVETALAGVTKPAAFVAVDREGNIRGAASRPIGEEFNRALLGQYPPGSTFKVITTQALLANGIAPDAPVSCPPTLTVGGKPFRNFEGEAASQLTLTEAFTISCNTAVIGAAQSLPAGALQTSAAQFGFDVDYNVGLITKGGSFPSAADPTELAADAIGQGTVTASPVHMATVAATVLSGRWSPARLVTDPAPATPSAKGSAPLDPTTQKQLDMLMHSVVTRGTGTKAAVPGQDIAGKTGTAEFGTGSPPPTHAWFIGYEPDLAIAVIVEGGGTGGADAAPVANRFFAAR